MQWYVFITAHLLGLCALVWSYRAYFLSVFERRGATGCRGATLCFQVLRRGFLWCGLEGHVESSWWGGSWRGNALALSQPAGSTFAWARPHNLWYVCVCVYIYIYIYFIFSLSSAKPTHRQYLNFASVWPTHKPPHMRRLYVHSDYAICVHFVWV